MTAAANAQTPKAKKGVTVPHVLVLLVIFIILTCGLTYILPPGEYNVDPKTGLVVANSFHAVDASPVSLWRAVMMLTEGIASQGVIFALLFIMGGLINVVIDSGSIHAIINAAVHRLEDKSIIVLVPCVVVLMSLIGALAGQDSLVAFVAVGMVLSRKLKLDRLAALGMFYLPYITGQAVGPTGAIILMAQETAGLPPVSGFGARIVIWLILTGLTIVYTTRYCLKVSRNPTASLSDGILAPEPGEALQSTGAEEKLGRHIATLSALLVPFLLYAWGAASMGWGFPELLAFAFIAVLAIGLFHRMDPNRLASSFVAGAAAMGGICLMIGFAKVIGMILIEGHILHTIANAAVVLIGELSEGLVATGIFLFTTIFNLLIPSGPAKVPMLVPLFLPVADVLGISRQVLCLAFQLGDGLTNCVTPVSAVLAAAMTLSGSNLAQWLRFVLPFVAMCFVIAIASLTVLQMMGWS